MPIFTGFFTTNTPYEKEAEVLRLCLDVLKLEHDIQPIDSRGSWLANTSFKPKFVRSMIDKYPNQPLVQIDVDSLLGWKRPTLFETLDCDVAAVMYSDSILLSGVMYFGGTAKATEFVDRWIAACAKYPDTLPDGREAWDQRVALMVIQEMPELRFVELPPEYNYIPDLSGEKFPDRNPVIIATRGGTRFRDLMDKE